MAYDPPIGSIYHVYTTYIYCLLGGYMLPTTLWEPETTIDWIFPELLIKGFLHGPPHSHKFPIPLPIQNPLKYGNGMGNLCPLLGVPGEIPNLMNNVSRKNGVYAPTFLVFNLSVYQSYFQSGNLAKILTFHDLNI